MPFVFVFVSLSIYPLYAEVFLSLHPSVTLSINLSLHPFMKYVCPSMYVFNLFLCPPIFQLIICLQFCLLICFSVFPSLHLSVYMFTSPSICCTSFSLFVSLHICMFIDFVFLYFYSTVHLLYVCFLKVSP